MNPLTIFAAMPYPMSLFVKAAIAVGLVLALLLALRQVDQRGYDRAMAEATAATNQLKAQAAATLASEADKALQAERALSRLKNLQELQDAAHKSTVADLSDRLRRLAGPAGRLRDPHAVGCGRGSGGAPGAAATTPSDRADNNPEASGLLSAGLSGLLQRLQLEADTINIAYASCRADAYAVRAVP